MSKTRTISRTRGAKGAGARARAGGKGANRYAAFWGCWVETRLPSVEASMRMIAKRFRLELHDMPGASCCPDPVLTALLDRELWVGMSARNLAISEGLGLNTLTVCNGCYETLFEANEALRDDGLRRRVNSLIKPYGKTIKGRREVKHVVEVLNDDVGLRRIRRAVKRPLKGLRVAVHPGCHLYRSRGLDDIELKPRIFEELTEATGVELVDYKLKKMCCGFPQRQADEAFALGETLNTKLKGIASAKADVVALICPACMMQFELGQIELARKFKVDYKIPVLNILEMLALALGASPGELGLEAHLIKVDEVLGKVGVK